MSTSTVPPLVLDRELIALLQQDLSQAQYTLDQLHEWLGEPLQGTLAITQAQIAKARQAHPHAPALVLAAFFLSVQPVTRAELDLALPRVGAAGLLALSLAVPARAADKNEDFDDDARLCAAVDLRPYSFSDISMSSHESEQLQLWVAADLGVEQTGTKLVDDYVMGIGQASLTLAQLTPRTPVAKALDLGAGCGIQTLHLVRHSEHVVATDISERALNFSEFNLVLNAVVLGLDPENIGQRVSLRLGSFFEPVAEERFDLIVSNPPFVITPVNSEHIYQYRATALPSDQVMATVISELENYLRLAGRAVMLGNWENHHNAVEPFKRLLPWIGEHLDAWVIQRDTQSPAEYAGTWLRDAGEELDPRWHERQAEAYVQDFAERGVASVAFGYLMFQSCEQPRSALRRMEVIDHPIHMPLGEYIDRFWSSWAQLKQAGPPAFAELKLTVAPDVREERIGRPGAEHPEGIFLRQGAGLARTVQMSTALAGFVSACDASLTNGSIAQAVTALLGQEEEGLAEELLEQAQWLYLDGFLVQEIT